jgi:hypothetical protein
MYRAGTEKSRDASPCIGDPFAGNIATPYPLDRSARRRTGLATSAAAAGASERSIMAQTGHRSVGMVRRYIRSGELFRENAAAVVGL